MVHNPKACGIVLILLRNVISFVFFGSELEWVQNTTNKSEVRIALKTDKYSRAFNPWLTFLSKLNPESKIETDSPNILHVFSNSIYFLLIQNEKVTGAIMDQTDRYR